MQKCRKPSGVVFCDKLLIVKSHQVGSSSGHPAMSSSCITYVKNPGSFRNKNKSLISVDPGLHKKSIKYIRHVSPSVGLGAGLRGESTASIMIRPGQDYASVYPLTDETFDSRRVYGKVIDLDFYSLYFPWKKSSFFIGMRMTAGQNQFAYSERTGQFALNGSETNVEWIDQTAEIGVPVGFSRNTVDNVNMFFGFSPTKIISTKRSFVDDGTTDDVDQEKRDLALKAFDGVRSGVVFKILASVGVAF